MLGLIKSLLRRGATQRMATRRAAHIERLELALKSIVDFWHPRCLDGTNGGYAVNFGPSGEMLAPGPKAIVTQARMLWFFSSLAQRGYRAPEMLDAAAHGYDFLSNQMWDRRHGGFYWEVDATGQRKTRPGKHLYGQAFALFALSEYAGVSGRQDVLSLATTLFDLMEAKAHDAVYGGYIEQFREDWSTSGRGAKAYVGGVAGDIKLTNTHLHLLEAMTAYYRAVQLPQARERLIELTRIVTSAVVRFGLTACSDRHRRDWTPLTDRASSRVSYGHDLESITLVVDACHALDQATAPFHGLFRDLFAYSLRYGHDEDRGGFFESGPFGRDADRRNKIWWVQAEAMLSCLVMHDLTRDRAYFEVFEKTWGYIDRSQIEWQGGEWHHTITEKGRVTGDRGSTWKAGYHTGRCVMQSVDLLKALTR